MHDLQMGKMVPQPARAIGNPGGFDGVERLPHGPVADGVDVHLEPFGIQQCDVLFQRLRVDERQPAVVGGVTVHVQIGRQHCCGEGLAHPVLHDLDGAGAESVRLGGRSPQRQETLHLLRPTPPLPPVRRYDASCQATVARQRE
jgi:hypothetical protein